MTNQPNNEENEIIKKQFLLIDELVHIIKLYNDREDKYYSLLIKTMIAVVISFTIIICAFFCYYFFSGWCDSNVKENTSYKYEYNDNILINLRIEGRVKRVERDIVELKTEYTLLKSEVDELKKTVADHCNFKTEIALLNRSIDNLTTVVTDLKENLDEINSRPQKLVGTVTSCIITSIVSLIVGFVCSFFLK